MTSPKIIGVPGAAPGYGECALASTEAVRSGKRHGAIENLRDCQGRLDDDGVEVAVSRQALDETLAILEQLLTALTNLHHRTVIGTIGERHDALDEAWPAMAHLDPIVAARSAIAAATATGEA